MDIEKIQLEFEIAQIAKRPYVLMRGNPFNSDDWNLGEEGLRGMHLVGVTRDRILAYVRENP